MLRDAAGFFGNYIRFADRIEERCFTMVHMTHDRDYGRSRHHGFDCIGLLFENVLRRFNARDFCFDTVFFSHEQGRIHVHGLVLGCHDAHSHEFLDNVAHLLAHYFGEFLDRAPLLDLDYFLSRLRDFCQICLLSVSFVLLEGSLAARQCLQIRKFFKGRLVPEFPLLFQLIVGLFLLPFFLRRLFPGSGRNERSGKL